jgi:hypothetical protein
VNEQIVTGPEPQPVNASHDQTCLLCRTVVLPAQPVTKISGKPGRGLAEDLSTTCAWAGEHR